MRIGVVADSHRNDGDLYLVSERLLDEEVDIIFHLGDNYDDGDILEETGIPVHRVKGNNDFGEGSFLQKITVEGISILITHGHHQRVSFFHDGITDKARELGCSCVCYGHTHVPYNEYEEGILVFNPGSLSYPRAGHPKSYGILEVEDGSVTGQIKKL